MNIKIDENTKVAKIKYMDSKQLKILDDVLSIETSYGDVQRIYNICGTHPLFGPSYCEKCAQENNKNGCGKWFVECKIEGAPDVTIATTLNGEVVISDDYEVLSIRNLC